MPADLRWMQGLLKSTTLEVYFMAKTQLLTAGQVRRGEGLRFFCQDLSMLSASTT